MQETWIRSLGWEDPLEKRRLPTPVWLGSPCGSAGEESACSAGDLGSVSGLGRSPGEGTGYPLWCSGLEDPMGSQRFRHDEATFSSFHFLLWCLVSLLHWYGSRCLRAQNWRLCPPARLTSLMYLSKPWTSRLYQTLVFAREGWSLQK